VVGGHDRADFAHDVTDASGVFVNGSFVVGDVDAVARR
jgi:hypothetical protein